jgi:hypothetical protein
MSVTVPGRSAVRLHRLTMVPEDDGVMVGRPDIGSYALFPEEGAQALRQLDGGRTLAEVADWYAQASGETLDVDDFLETLDELRFTLADGEQRGGAKPVRWQRLGRWTFSAPAWLLYLALITGAVLAMGHEPALRPSYRSLFFTDRLSIIPIVFTLLAMPCIVIHEAFHALAGRRLGLPSSFGIGRRLYFLVAETRLDSLLSVPRRQRYLPFLAGMLADLVVMSLLTLLAVLLRVSGSPAWCPALCVAIAFSCVLRLIWQFMFYLETDLYFLATNALHCSDLQNASRFRIRTLTARWLRRPVPETEAEWSDSDLAAARWYAPLLIAGYGFSLGSLAWVGLPTTARFWTTVFHRLTQPGTSTGEIVDALIFLGLTLAQLGLLVYVTIRDWRARRREAASSMGELP